MNDVTLQPIATLEMGQFSEKYEDLPVMEIEKSPVNGKMYRSARHLRHVFVYRSSTGTWDCFIRG